MSAAIILLVHSLRRVRWLLLVMGLVLAGFQVVLILVASSIQESNAFDQLALLIPDFVRQLLGPSFTGLMSFGGIVCVGYFHVAVMGVLIGLGITLATEVASEIETRFMDLILSRPIARHWVVTRSVALLLIGVVFLLVMMQLGTRMGLRWYAAGNVAAPSGHLIHSLALNLGFLMLSWGGVALGVSAVSRRRAVAGSLVGFAAFATFLLDYVARAWKPAEAIAWLSPFRYYSPLDLVMGAEIPPKNLLVLGGIALAGISAAYIGFSRRDL